MEKVLTKKAPPGRQSHHGRRGVSKQRATPSQSAPGGVTRPVADQSQSMSIGGVPLYPKRIDNSGIRYRHDPRDREVWRVGLSLCLFLLVLAILLWGPQRLVTQSGYKQEALRQRAGQLQAVRDELKMQRGRLEDLRRVAALAEQMGLRQTEPDSYSWFALPPGDGESDATVARLLRSGE